MRRRTSHCEARHRVAKSPTDPIRASGARPTPPRDVYLRKLDQSHIFIGIYRDSYGWVAPGATISGIDDELRRSGQRGMPRLVYIYEADQNRDPRLKALLGSVDKEVTFWRFRNADGLYERIRDDIEAEVTRRFHEAERLEAIVKTDAATAISGLVPAPRHLLRRKSLGEDLIKQLSVHQVLQVSGELGIGKTVFLATLARENNFLSLAEPSSTTMNSRPSFQISSPPLREVRAATSLMRQPRFQRSLIHGELRKNLLW